MLRGWVRAVRAVLVTCSVAATAGVFVLSTVPAAAESGAAPTCKSVSIPTLNAALGIDAADVSSVRPSRPAGALICSYYGLSGRAKNEATINYLPVTSLAFAGVEKSLSSQYAVVTVTGIKAASYEYYLKGEYYLYVLDGRYQVQLFAARPLARLERLARELPNF